jgi:hypothetical protein
VASRRLFSDWTEEGAYRETFLYRLGPAAAGAFRVVGREVCLWSMEYPGTGACDDSAELRAVAADLRYLGGFLVHGVAADAEPLAARLVAGWAERIARLAEEIEAAGEES